MSLSPVRVQRAPQDLQEPTARPGLEQDQEAEQATQAGQRCRGRPHHAHVLLSQHPEFPGQGLRLGAGTDTDAAAAVRASETAAAETDGTADAGNLAPDAFGGKSGDSGGDTATETED